MCFMLVSITQNDQADTVLPFCQSGSPEYVPRITDPPNKAVPCLALHVYTCV